MTNMSWSEKGKHFSAILKYIDHMTFFANWSGMMDRLSAVFVEWYVTDGNVMIQGASSLRVIYVAYLEVGRLMLWIHVSLPLHKYVLNVIL